MKIKKIIIIFLITILSIIVIGYLIRSTLTYNVFKNPNKDFFGKQYWEILHITSGNDYDIANEILDFANNAFSSITTKENAEEKYGELSRYSIITEYYKDAISEEHKIDLITANFKENTGYMWVVYTHVAYDQKNELTYGSWDILARWELEKIDGIWTVINTKEHP